MTDWDQRARRLIELARDGHDPTPARKSRLTAALIARCVADPALATASTAALAAKGVAGAGAKLGVFGLPLWGTFAVGAAAGAFTAGTLFYAQQSLAPAPPVQQDRLPAVMVLTTDSRSPAPAAAPSAPVAPLRESAPRTAPPSLIPRMEPGRGSQSGLELELQGLRRAQRSLHRGDPRAALTELDALDRTGASDALFEERLATRALAECTSGGGTGTSTEFARRFPASVHLGRVALACRGARKSPEPSNGSGVLPSQGVEELESDER